MLKIYQYKNIVIDTIQRNKRRINAYARQNLIKRIKLYIMIALIFSLNFNNIFAIENSNIHYGDYQIFCKKDPYMYIKYEGKMIPNYEYYYIKDNQKYPAYCLNYGLKGAEEFETGYFVDVANQINDNGLKLIVLNSYPYKSIEELELNSEDEAIFASQFAIWCYLGNFDINLIEPISNLNDKLVEVIKQIYSSKDGDLSSKEINIEIDCSKQKCEKINNNNYYYKTITINDRNINNIVISTQDSNVIIEKTENKNEYKISVPVESVNNSYITNINIELNLKENCVLFGKSKLANFQDLAITLNNNFDTIVEKNIEFEKYESNIVINKIDIDNKEKLSGVEFLILDDENNIIDKCVTDDNGMAAFKLFNIESENIIIKETKVKDKYKLNNSTYTVEINPNEIKEINIYNEKQKGKIEIIKKTKQYNENTGLPENTPLCGVEFDILDEDNKVVDTLVTDEFGYAQTKELPLGKYYIKEKKTNEYYKIIEKEILVEILNENDNINVQILNDNAYVEEKLPVTGK